MDYILQNMQYRYMENVIQQINRGAVQNVTKPSLSGTGFAHIFNRRRWRKAGSAQEIWMQFLKRLPGRTAFRQIC